ncbi:MAG: glycosyltransferase, partial [Paraclostridium bifermentans]
YGIDDEDIVFGIVAGLRDVKDHMTLLKAINLLKEQNQKFKLLIIGDGKNRDKINSYVQKNEISRYVRIIGETIDVYKFLNIIDVGVLCSIQEGLSNSIIEYMLCKNPVIATNVGGNIELVKDNETGLLINVGDFEELSNKMLFLIKNKELIKSYGEKSYEFAYEKFKYENMVESYENLYEKLIDFRKNE